MIVPVDFLGRTLYICCPAVLTDSTPFHSQQCPNFDNKLHGRPIYNLLISATADLRGEKTCQFGVLEPCLLLSHGPPTPSTSVIFRGITTFGLQTLLSLDVMHCSSMNSGVVLPHTSVSKHLSSPFFIVLAVSLWQCQNFLFRPLNL